MADLKATNLTNVIGMHYSRVVLQGLEEFVALTGRLLNTYFKKVVATCAKAISNQHDTTLTHFQP